MSAYDYDLFVIGAGSGGVRAARMSASYGAKVGIAEEYRVGGTCVIRGCIPKKLFVYASRYGDAIDDAAGFGWTVTGKSFDWPTLVANKDREIDRLSGIYVRNLERAGAKLFLTRAVLRDANTVELVGENRTVTARNILIAVGGRPFVPPFPGHEHAITSNEAFHLERLPGSILIVGGGYIALEFASIFAGLGVHVTLVYRGDQVLRGFDDDLRDGVAEAMRRRGINLRVSTDLAEIAKEGSGYAARTKSGDELKADLVMYATGRVPNTAGLGAQKLGIECGWNGHIVVNEYSRSSIGNIYAVGDVTHRMNLTPVAIHEGAAVAETLFNDNPTAVDHTYVPTAVFCEPEIGRVGMTEVEAREKYPSVDIYKSRFRPLMHTLTGRDEPMLMKLVVDGKSGRVLGCHIMGPDAAEIVQMAAIAIRMSATKADFDATMALHPSAAEELVTMREKWLTPEAKAAE